MRPLIVVLLAALAFSPLGCKRPRSAPASAGADGTTELASTIHMGDPKAAEQLIAGFHQVEEKTWRWTAREFSLVLRPPRGAAELGAALQVQITVPPVVIEKLTNIRLSASIGGTVLTPQTYTKPGEYVYQADVPAALLKGGAVKVEFTLDKAIPSGAADERELGIIVTSAGLKLK
jgi:hypothetical protein